MSSGASRFELLLSRLLRGGVVLSVGLILLGSAIDFARHAADWSSPQALAAWLAAPEARRNLAGIARGAVTFDGGALVMLGLLTLIATPVLRVAASVFAFAQQKAVDFIVMTSVVLVLLLVAFTLGGS
jgi:uncharacterized membrane protein